MTMGRVVTPGPTRNRDFSRSTKEAMKANSAPATTPGRMSGHVTRRNAVNGRAPMARAASFNCGSSPTSEAVTSRTVQGSSISLWAMARPQNVMAACTPLASSTSIRNM